MKIFKVKSVRKKNRYTSNCVIEFYNIPDKIELHIDIVISNGVAKESELNNSQIEELNNSHQLLMAKQQCYRYAAMKPRTKKQILEYMRNKTIDERYDAKVLDFLNQFGLIDEYKFAISFINSALLRKNVGISKLIAELNAKGVSKDVATKAINEVYPKDDILDIAKSAAMKKLKLIQKKPLEKQKASLRNHLLYLGFDFDTVKETLGRFFAN